MGLVLFLMQFLLLINFCVSFSVGSFVRDMQKTFQDRLADSSTTAEESISNIRTVKCFSQEPKTSDLYSKDINASYDVGKTVAFASGNFLFIYRQCFIAKHENPPTM